MSAQGDLYGNDVLLEVGARGRPIGISRRFNAVAGVLAFNAEQSEKALRKERPWFRFKEVWYYVRKNDAGQWVECWRAIGTKRRGQ